MFEKNKGEKSASIGFVKLSAWSRMELWARKCSPR